MSRETQIDVDGASLFCRSDGPGGDAPWIVFSNSLVTDLSIWDAQVATLSDRYNILRYDQRGHGRSSASTEPLTFDRLGDDLVALLDAFAINRFCFVGLSMGVPTGLRAYQRVPERFEKIVFVDGMARTAPTGAAQWQERIDLVAEHGMAEFARATVARWLQDDTRQSARGERLEAMIAETPADGFVQCVRALQAYDYADTAAAISVPLLAIAGAEDGAMPATMEKVFGGLKGADIAIIPAAGHVPNFERPNAFNAVLERFLGDPS